MVTSKYVIFLLIFLLSIFGMLISRLMYKYLKSNYPHIWETFEFPNNSARLSDVRDERQHAKALIRSKFFIWSKRRRDLQDSYLNRLTVLLTSLVFIVSLLICAFTVSIFGDNLQLP